MTGAPTLTRNVLAAMIDHTLLAPEATPKDIDALCAEAKELATYAVCLSPTLTTVAAREVAGSFVKVVAVAGFPSGAHSAGLKAQEAGIAAATGAHEVDMVINLGLARQGRWKEVEEEIAAVRGEVPSPTLLKVIIESAILDDEAIVMACRTAESAGADFVKTSTGFHPAGGATTAAVALMLSSTTCNASASSFRVNSTCATSARSCAASTPRLICSLRAGSTNCSL